MRRLTGAALTALIVITMTLGAAGVAVAQEFSIEVSPPTSVAVGDEVSIPVRVVRSDGRPAVRVAVSLTAEGSFGEAAGRYELTGATTDDEGRAVLAYQQRAGSNGEMRVEVEGPDGTEFTAFTIDVAPGGPVFRPDQGIDIPWLGGGWIVALVVIVWGLVAYAVSRVVTVARQAPDTTTAAARRFPAVAFAVIVLAGAGLVVVLLRNPDTHANLAGPEGYTRTPVADVGVQYAFAGPSNELLGANSTGEQLFVEAECMACHGSKGRGAVVGGPIVGELDEGLDDFIATVRRGPKGMPAFVPEVLSDEQIARIFEYLETVNP